MSSLTSDVRREVETRTDLFHSALALPPLFHPVVSSSPASSPASSPLSSPPDSPSVASPTPGSTDFASPAPTDTQHPATSRRKRQAPHTTPSPPLSPTRRVTSSGQDVPSPTLCAKKRRIVSPPSSPSPLSEAISPKQATSHEPKLEPEQLISPKKQKQPVNLRAQVLIDRGKSEPPRRIPFFKFKGEAKNAVAITPAGEEDAAREVRPNRLYPPKVPTCPTMIS